MKVLITPETEEFFCFRVRTEIFNKSKFADTLKEVSMETITLISSGVDKIWPVQVRGTHPLFGNQKVEPPFKSKPFSTSLVLHTYLCA